MLFGVLTAQITGRDIFLYVTWCNLLEVLSADALEKGFASISTSKMKD
jgi:hypothetical protein